MKKINNLSPKSLYPHLSEDEFVLHEKLCSSYSFDNITDAEKNASDTLTNELDLLCPVMSSGWRCSDIDALNNAVDPIKQNVLLGRLRPQSSNIDTSGLSDSDLIARQIPRNLTNSDVDLLASEYNEASKIVSDTVKDIQRTVKTSSNDEE